MYGYIYKITCLVNNKIYVGKTKDIQLRFKKHKRESFRPGPKYNQVIHCAIRKYGVDNFTIEQIDQAENLEELNKKEKYWIYKLDCRNKEVGYNIALGGDGGWMGTDQSGENNPMYGKNAYEGKTSEEMEAIAAKKSKSLTGKVRTNDQKIHYKESKLGDKNPMRGKFGSKHHNFGKKMYNNGIINKMYIPGTEPVGFISGCKERYNG